MAEATITIKLNPRQFDVLRFQLNRRLDFLTESVSDGTVSAPDRAAYRAQAVELQAVLENLQ